MEKQKIVNQAFRGVSYVSSREKHLRRTSLGTKVKNKVVNSN